MAQTQDKYFVPHDTRWPIVTSIGLFLLFAGVSVFLNGGDLGKWVAFFGMGLLANVLPFCLIVWGQIHVASGVALILNATTPLFAVVVAHFWTSDEKLTIGRLLVVALGFIGVVVMVGSEALQGLNTNL